MFTTTRMSASTAALPRRDGPLPLANIGRAPNTIDAYGRAAEDHLRFCAVEGADPLLARPDTIAAWIRDMLDRHLRPAKGLRRADTGLSNATVQQRLVAVRSFYEYLVEDGLREPDPVRRDRQAVVVADRGRASCDTSSKPRGSSARRAGADSG